MSDVQLREGQVSVAWQPQEGPQTAFLQCPAFEVLYGGAVGGGKTDALLGDFAAGIGQGSRWRGVFIRRMFTDMDDVIHRSMEIFGPVFGEKCFKRSPNPEWNFPGGECLMLRACEKDMDVYKFQSKQYSWVAWDELTQWESPFAYTYLMSRIRSAKGATCRVRAATNPGGPGHGWVKQRFVDQMPPNTPLRVETPSGSYWRVFIPAKLEDNQILMKADPSYADRIYEVDDPMLARALRTGDWNIVAGAAFPEFDPRVHVIDPLPIPTDGRVFRSLDWGMGEPWGCVWMWERDGQIVVGHEMYGWNGKANKGTGETAAEVRQKIENFERMNDIYVPMGYLDPQCWAPQSGSAPVMEQLGGRQMGWKKWPKYPGSAIQNVQNFHSLLSVTNGRPQIVFTRNCTHSIRTIPQLQVDDNNREAIKTRGVEDHLFDAITGGLHRKIPTRQELRDKAMRRRLMNTGFVTAEDLPFGGF